MYRETRMVQSHPTRVRTDILTTLLHKATNSLYGNGKIRLQGEEQTR